MKRFVIGLALLLAFALPAFAQLQGGSISGIIKDDQGGVLPGVTVTAQGVDATQTFTTGADGEYRFLNLAPGPYTVTATLQGFSTLVRENIVVAVGRSVDLPLTLKIATVAETITVSDRRTDPLGAGLRDARGDHHQRRPRRAHQFFGLSVAQDRRSAQQVEAIIMPTGGFWGGVGEPPIGAVVPALAMRSSRRRASVCARCR